MFVCVLVVYNPQFSCSFEEGRMTVVVRDAGGEEEHKLEVQLYGKVRVGEGDQAWMDTYFTKWVVW